MFTEKQKTILREMIERRPYAAYMAELAANDEFALSEITQFSTIRKEELDAQQIALDEAKELYK